jgi:16S rRNA (cytosine967-C5)-methyltransferase
VFNLAAVCALSGTDFAAFVAQTAVATLNHKSHQLRSTTLDTLITIQRLAAQTLAAVLSGKSLTAQLEAVWTANTGLKPAERGAIQDICYGSLRYLGRLDSVLRQLVAKPIIIPEVRTLLLATLYQLEYTGAAPYAVVHHAVDCATHLGGRAIKPFINAVLRTYQRQRVLLLAAADKTEAGKFSFPAWWIEQLRHELPVSAERVMELANRPPPMTLRVNRRRCTVQEYLTMLTSADHAGRAIDDCAIVLRQPVPVLKLPGFKEGLVSVQDAGAQKAARLLDLKMGMKVLDACAAPGGKTAHLCELEDVAVTALDIDPARISRIDSNLERLRLAARTMQADAAELDSWWDGLPFERVLLDAPCSASGVVRRHPDIKWLRKPGDIRQFATQQHRLLEALWKVVAPGGKLLYATCSIFSEENQQQIGQFLVRHPEARVLGPAPGHDGLLLPDEEHDGFYYALLQKN